MEQHETPLNTKSSCMAPASSVRLVDVIIGLLRRDRITEALDCQLVAMTFALDNDMTTEDAMRLSLDDMEEMMPPPPQKVPYVPQVRGKWDKIWYGENAFRDDDE